MFQAPSGVWSTHLSLTYNEVSHTSDLQDCNRKMRVWSRTVGTYSPAWNTSVCKVSFGTDHLFTHANNFYQFGRTADLAMHSHIKVPGKKNYSNLHYGWHNTHVKKMTHEQSAQVSTSQLYCWWGPSSKGRIFLIPKVNTDLMFCKGAIYSEFPVLCFGSHNSQESLRAELWYYFTFNTKDSSVLNEDLNVQHFMLLVKWCVVTRLGRTPFPLSCILWVQGKGGRQEISYKLNQNPLQGKEKFKRGILSF